MLEMLQPVIERLQTLFGPIGIVLLGIAVLTAIVWLHHAQALEGRIPALRRLPALDIIREALGRGAETGKAIHISPGAGTIGTRATTAETIVGLLAAERVAVEAARNGAPILVSSGDAVAHLALQGTLRQAYQNAGQGQDYNPQSVQLLAHQDTTAYAAGVAALYGRQKLEASQMIGSFQQDFLLLSEEGAQRAIPQVAGATSPAALPLLMLSTDGSLIGEEVFAAEAFLSDEAASLARLRSQDLLRHAVITLLVLGLLYGIAQPFVGLPPLPRI